MIFRLTQEEINDLKQLHRSERDRKKCDRIKAILMLNEGYSAVEIAKVLLIDNNTITGWKNRYLNRKGTMDWLLSQCEGYQGKLTDEQKSKVEAYVRQSLICDSKEVQKFIKDTFLKSYSLSGVIELLHRLDFSYKKTTLIPSKMDSEKQAEFKELYDEFKDNLKEDEALLFLDGVHPQHNTKSSYAWIKTGEEKHIKSNSGRSRLNISGAYNPLTQDILVREDKTINSETVIAFFKQIEASYSSKATIFAISDQAPYYKNKEVAKFLETSRIELIYLPPYSPNLNLIERLWKLLRKKIINTFYYEKFSDFKKAVLSFFTNHSPEFKKELKSFIGLELHLINST